MPSVIKPCVCKHEYQDAKYGEGRRVHNLMGPAKDPKKGFVCTVCGTKKV